MNLQQLQQLHAYLWTLPKAPGGKRAEVLLYGNASLLESMDDKVLEQIANVAALPGLVGAAMTMPDAHWGYGFPIGGVAAFDADLEYVEENGCVTGAVPGNVSELAKKRQRGEMGTLGSGNHYLEVQVVERIYDDVTAQAFGLHQGQLVISIHCGSRGLGHQIDTDYLVMLAKAAGRLGSHLPDRELACTPIKSPEGQQYLGAINCALANR